MKALFVDDDLETEVLVKVLRARHPDDSFDLADTLPDARQKIWSEKYDVIVFDIMMPADETAAPGSSEDAGLITGLLLLDLMRGDPKCLNQITRPVLLTGLVPSEHSKVAAAQKAFGESFMQKPMHPDTVYEILNKPSAPL